MKTVLLALVTLGFAANAHAANYVCKSSGPNLPENRLFYSVELEHTWWGRVTGGTYHYSLTEGSPELGQGKFACAAPNDKGVVFCGPLAADANISRIVVHPVLGLAFEITGQPHVVLFDCK